mgnify:CR=1 FL=1
MKLQQILIPEFQYEVTLTEKFIKRIPQSKMDWRPHPKSMTIGELANNLAEIPQWVAAIMDKEELDLAAYKAPAHNNTEDIVKLLRNGASAAEAALRKPDDAYQDIWKLRKGDHILIEMPRMNVLRTLAINQLPHHRAQLGVYFRLLDISVPSTYGPSADEV